MYGLHNYLKAVPGKGRQLADILVKASEIVGKLEGCKAYLVSSDTTDDDKVWVTEYWIDKEAHDSSLQLPEVRALIAEAMPILDGMPAGGPELTLIGGYGID